MKDYTDLGHNDLTNFYIVRTRGYSITIVTAFNPVTMEEFEQMVYDYDDPWYEMTYDEVASLPRATDEVMKLYNHFKGIIQEGDLVKIVKGRKFVGELKRVTKKFEFKVPHTKNITVDYLVFEDGSKVTEFNCELIHEYKRYEF